jgi:hypothetical protein
MVPSDNELQERQAALVEMNVRWLKQALNLVGRVDDATFATSPPPLAPHKVGDHLRHILEFYECFLDGLDLAHIDYDARRRDECLAGNRLVAMARIASIVDRLESDPQLRGDALLFVRMEDAVALGGTEEYLTSSVGRELQALSSHTIHHFALIAMTLRAHGYPVNEDFGVAPSTLRYRGRKPAQLTAVEAA